MFFNKLDIEIKFNNNINDILIIIIKIKHLSKKLLVLYI